MPLSALRALHGCQLYHRPIPPRQHVGPDLHRNPVTTDQGHSAASGHVYAGYVETSADAIYQKHRVSKDEKGNK